MFLSSPDLLPPFPFPHPEPAREEERPQRYDLGPWFYLNVWFAALGTVYLVQGLARMLSIYMVEEVL